AKRGQLKLIGIRIGEIETSFSPRAQPVLGAKIALIGAAPRRNQFQHAIEVFLADIERDVDRPAVPLGAIGQRGNRTNADHLVIGKLEEGFTLIFAYRFKPERFGIKSLGAREIGGFKDHMTQADLAERLPVHTDFDVIIVKVSKTQRARKG